MNFLHPLVTIYKPWLIIYSPWQNGINLKLWLLIHWNRYFKSWSKHHCLLQYIHTSGQLNNLEMFSFSLTVLWVAVIDIVRVNTSQTSIHSRIIVMPSPVFEGLVHMIIWPQKSTGLLVFVNSKMLAWPLIALISKKHFLNNL